MSTNAPNTSNAQTGPQRLGKYELRERLGRGGMAEVWKAFDPQLQRYVAIKLLHADLQTDPEFITRFSREARMIAALHHPNIVQIFDFQTTPAPGANMPAAYMVMDFIEGPTLAHYIHHTSRAGKFPPPAEILHIFTGISKAIDYAHQQGMIHRDIKPANILLDKRNILRSSIGEPVLTDFGIAKILGTSTGTVSGMWLGTPLYISPEQAKGYPGNERSDIYSLGVILYEMMTGVPPFRGESVPAIMARQISDTPLSPALINPAIPPALTLVILRAMAKNPAERFSSASAMVAALAEALNLPVPTDLYYPVSDSTYLMDPTISGSQPPKPMPGGTSGNMPAMPPSPLVSPLSPISPINVATNLSPAPAVTPVSNHAVAPPPATPVPAPGTQSMTPASPGIWSPPPAPPRPERRQISRKWVIISALAVLLVLAGATTGALLAFGHGGPPGPGPGARPAPGGSVIFLNSGLVNSINSQGVDDEVQIELHNIPNPPPGESYYAWLKDVPINDEGAWILLGVLRVNQGNAQLPSPYQDPQHANLLVNASSFLVTEDSSSVAPVQPSTDRSTWILYSQPPVITLTHLRHLLAGSPELNVRQLYGGLAIWFWRNTEKVVEWAGSARDDAQNSPPAPDAVHRQLIRILDYIDGAASVSMDVPPNTPLLVSPQDAQVALVGPPVTLGPPGDLYNGKGQIPPGYVYLIRVHLDAAVSAPGATAQQHQLANEIEAELNQVTSDLQQVRQDARQLIGLSGAQLTTPQALALLDDMTTHAENAFAGSINPGQPQGGASGIYADIQRMAAFDVEPFANQ
jgi:serine/threonine protein kinase